MENLKNILREEFVSTHVAINLLYAVLTDEQKAKFGELKKNSSIQSEAEKAVDLALTLLDEQKPQ